MEITEIRVKLTMDPRNKLKAFCSVTFDDAFVVRDLKIIEGSKGPFVAMPSRKLADRCRRCGGKNPLTAAYCSSCGTKLDASRATRDQRGRAKLHADLAHPVNSACRIELHRAVINAFSDEVDKSQVDGYQPAPDEELRVDLVLVTPGYFESLGLPIRQGRTFDASDDEARSDVTIVSRSMANAYWPDGQAVGSTMRIGGQPVEVVGVVDDVTWNSLADEVTSYAFAPLAQSPAQAARSFITLSVRTN